MARGLRGRNLPRLRQIAAQLAFLPPEGQARLLGTMTPADLADLEGAFDAWAHPGQDPPPGDHWRTWLMLAGRGFGKTRAGAEWITGLATRPGAPVRIALVGATENEARAVMVEGESGLLAVGARREMEPRWEPSLGRLSWRGGSEARLFSGENPDGLRGPQHHHAWCDELAKWARAEESWNNLQLTLRAGERPRVLVTTTPRPLPLLTRIEEDPRTVITRGRTVDNLNLAADFAAAMKELFGGTALGRQELDGETIADVEGALWTRAGIEACRGPALLPGDAALARVLIGVDPPASGAGTCGIVACGLDRDGIGQVLDDRSVGGLSPDGWARAVAATAADWGAEAVIAETNQGGEMVESILAGADAAMPVRPVRARFGKARRAEPVALRFARGKARFAGRFPALEDELCGLVAGGGYGGPGRSPDRADACVWAMAELLMAPVATPRVRFL